MRLIRGRLGKCFPTSFTDGRMSQMLDLIWSAISLMSFWLIGAVIFHAIEGWSYG
jgi:hypothetical protein